MAEGSQCQVCRRSGSPSPPQSKKNIFQAVRFPTAAPALGICKLSAKRVEDAATSAYCICILLCVHFGFLCLRMPKLIREQAASCSAGLSGLGPRSLLSASSQREESSRQTCKDLTLVPQTPALLVLLWEFEKRRRIPCQLVTYSCKHLATS